MINDIFQRKIAQQKTYIIIQIANGYELQQSQHINTQTSEL